MMNDKEIAISIEKARLLVPFFPWHVGQNAGERGFRAYKWEIIDGEPTGDSVEWSEEFPTFREAQAECDKRNGGSVYEAMDKVVLTVGAKA
jgi:aspartate/methionine/tyrosine aminotransferase